MLADTDADGVGDSLDVFPLDAAETVDTDNDGIGNNTDTDDDGDTLLDTDEVAAGPTSGTDSDNDGVNDNLDAFPSMMRRSIPMATASAITPIRRRRRHPPDTDEVAPEQPLLADTDADGVGDSLDAFLDDDRTLDTDGDGVGITPTSMTMATASDNLMPSRSIIQEIYKDGEVSATTPTPMMMAIPSSTPMRWLPGLILC